MITLKRSVGRTALLLCINVSILTPKGKFNLLASYFLGDLVFHQPTHWRRLPPLKLLTSNFFPKATNSFSKLMLIKSYFIPTMSQTRLSILSISSYGNLSHVNTFHICRFILRVFKRKSPQEPITYAATASSA